MKVIQIEYNSTLYQQEIILRDNILRKPLGLDINDDDLSDEINQDHFGLLDDESNLIGCLIIKKNGDNAVQLRQMAISEKLHKKGMGKLLVTEVESILKKASVQKIILHARKNVSGFYKKLGYNKFGEEFIEVSIPHIMMEKYL